MRRGFCQGKCNIPFKDFTSLTYSMTPRNKVEEIPVFRMIGLDGTLKSKPPTSIDYDLFNRVYQKMIYTEEMDNILLMSKGQGITTFTQEKSPFI